MVGWKPVVVVAWVRACARAPVAVEIYDVQGAVVRRLGARTMDPGWHTLAWDGRDESGRTAGAGVYFVRVSAGDQRITLRVALVR